jgi:cytochrome c553
MTSNPATVWPTVLAVAVIGWLTSVGTSNRSSVAQEAGPAATQADEQREFFEKRVRPLLAAHCYECHSAQANKLQANLRLDQRAAMLRGGDSGPAVVPGDPEESLLISAVRYDSFEMPPRGKLTDEQIATLERWVAQGAWWPPERADEGSEFAAEAEPVFDWQSRQASHWAWQPLTNPTPPRPTTPNEAAGPIDSFILARLVQADLRPGPRAAAHHLVRRLYLDLVGLPPSPVAVREFTEAPTALNYRRLIDRLLDSPQFGEKWARHWLDLVRYADTCGHEFDYPIPHADRYRDYVVRALNADVPYDQFVREHIAGDLLPRPRRHPVAGTDESILGTGFWFLGEAVHAPTDVRGDEADRIDNQIDVFGKTFLAMTIGCARCHDHKFDPIPTQDYYALAGFLQSSRRQLAMLDPHDEISQMTAVIADRRAAGDRRLRAAVANDKQPMIDEFAELLLKAEFYRRDRPPESRANGGSSDVAGAPAAKIPPALWVARLAAALDDDQLQSPQHPLYTWRVLADAAAQESFEAERARLSERLVAQQHAHNQALAQMISLADFRRADYGDWFVTGWAFGTCPTAVAQWDGPETRAQFAPPFVAHSGRFGATQQGVLRSPTFTLEHSRIHYRLLAKHVQIRLIVDGYVMDTYNSLLFADNTLENVDTQGRYRWVTQREDLDHYQGHRAHLEIIDQGEGFAAVEGIYFSDADPPAEAVHPLNLQLSSNTGLRSLADLAAAYEDALGQASANIGTVAGADDHGLWNWLLTWQLVDPPDDWNDFAQTIDQLQAALPVPELVTAMTDGTGEDERLHIRGNHRNLGPTVARRAPVVVTGEPCTIAGAGSGRLELAERLASRDNPLLARVIVNRLWHHLMGRGLVPTVDDFGAMGQTPTHPELLDWLARDLMDHGWSLKRTIRQIVLSETYQRATATSDPAAAAADPENQMWHQARLRRLTAEQLRDAMLCISGRLDSRLLGPGVPVHLTEFMTGRGRPPSGPLDGDGRRSIYIQVQRNFLSPMMLAFDMPAPFSTMGRRSVSNVPAQSLILLNDAFVWQQARRWAGRLCEASTRPEQRIDQAFLQAFARPPVATEVARLQQFIEAQAALRNCPVDSIEVWTDVCHALWNTKEFLYVF